MFIYNEVFTLRLLRDVTYAGLRVTVQSVQVYGIRIKFSDTFYKCPVGSSDNPKVTSLLSSKLSSYSHFQAFWCNEPTTPSHSFFHMADNSSSSSWSNLAKMSSMEGMYKFSSFTAFGTWTFELDTTDVEDVSSRLRLQAQDAGAGFVAGAPLKLWMPWRRSAATGLSLAIWLYLLV